MCYRGLGGVCTLFYECYRGYTIYSTQVVRCCTHGKQRGLRLLGKLFCSTDIEEAKTLIKRLRAESYTASDPVKQYVPVKAYMCPNRHEQQRASTLSSAMQRIVSAGTRGEAYRLFPSHEEYIQEEIAMCEVTPCYSVRRSKSR